MASGPVSVSLALDRPALYPGDTANLTVSIQAEKPHTIYETTFELVLIQKMRRPSSTSLSEMFLDDYETEEIIVQSGVVLSKQPVSTGFSFNAAIPLAIPADGVASINGKVFSARWLARLKGGLSGEIEIPVLVSPPGVWTKPGLYAFEMGSFNTPNAEPDQLVLFLPRLEWSEGETISGKLMFRRKKKTSYINGAIRLVRDESTYAGKSDFFNEAKVALWDGSREFGPGRVEEVSFAVQVPAPVYPSGGTSKGAATWSLQFEAGGIMGTMLKKRIYLYSSSDSA